MNWTRVLLWTLTAGGLLSLPLWSSARPAAAPDVLATVDGTPLTQLDLQLKLRPEHTPQASAEPTPDYRQKVLETMIGQELAARKAIELGLDGDAEFKRGLAPLEAQVNAYKRKALSDLLAQHAVSAGGGVTDLEARAFFEQNAERLRTQVQVFQILRRTRESIEQARQELEAAPSFEAYMRTQFSQLPESEHPWDLGYLRWEQLPEQWREVVYTMKKGEVSGVIQGQKDRFWILKLVDTRLDPTVTFETTRPTLLEALKGKKLAELELRTQRELREAAQVIYVRAP